MTIADIPTNSSLIDAIVATTTSTATITMIVGVAMIVIATTANATCSYRPSFRYG